MTIFMGVDQGVRLDEALVYWRITESGHFRPLIPGESQVCFHVPLNFMPLSGDLEVALSHGDAA